MMKKWKILQFIVTVATILVLGLLSGTFVTNSSFDYTSLERPFFAPPGWLFGVAWTILYILIGIVFARLIEKSFGEKQNKEGKGTLILFTVHFIMNLLWSFWFFGLGLFWFSAVWIILMDILLWVILTRLKKIDPLSWKLMIPYFLWLLFATALNLSIAFLN